MKYFYSRHFLSCTKPELICIFLFFLSFFGHAQQPFPGDPIPPDQIPGTTIPGVLEHDGLQRQYLLYIPSTYTGLQEVPLVINFHGYGSNAFEQLNYGDFRLLAEKNKFLVVHPQGTLDALGSTHFNVDWGRSTVDDVGFTGALIDDLSSKFTIDAKRIYSTGMSNGGFMSYKLACELSDKIAAIASVTGSMTRGQRNDCDILHPVPVLQIHGTNDATVPYNGNALFESMREVLRFWERTNNTVRRPQVSKLPDINTNDNSRVQHYIFSDGENDVNVEFLEVINGGHTWPGARFEIGPVTNQDIDASAQIWEFFSRYDINGVINDDIEDGAADSNELEIKVYPNPATSYLHISSHNNIDQYKLVDLSGVVVLSGSLNDNDLIDISRVSRGIYFLVIDNKRFRILKTR